MRVPANQSKPDTAPQVGFVNFEAKFSNGGQLTTGCGSPLHALAVSFAEMLDAMAESNLTAQGFGGGCGEEGERMAHESRPLKKVPDGDKVDTFLRSMTPVKLNVRLLLFC